MSDQVLRTKLIRLASDHPEFRKELLPLLSKKAATSVTKQDVIQKIKGGEFGEQWDAGIAFPTIVSRKLRGPPDEVEVLTLEVDEVPTNPQWDQGVEALVKMTWHLTSVDGVNTSDAVITLVYPFNWTVDQF